MSLTVTFPSTVTAYSDNYPYRTWLCDMLDVRWPFCIKMCNTFQRVFCLQYSEEAKKTQLSPQGWESDITGYYNSSDNMGWRRRRARFIKYERTMNASNQTEDIAFTQQEFRDDHVLFTG